MLCKNCRAELSISSEQLRKHFEQEYRSAVLAFQTGHIVVIHLDHARRLFPLIYAWLDLESTVFLI